MTTPKPKPPTKQKNIDRRDREYLRPEEVKQLRDAARQVGYFGHRDWLLILITYRHAMRLSEVTALKWDDVSFSQRTILIRRLKGGTSSEHFLESQELKALDQLRKQFPNSIYIFCTRRETKMSRRTVHAIIARAGELAELPFSIHPHMLRHSKGYQLAAKGTDTRAIQGYIGHKHISSTVRYTELAANRFKGFGRGDEIKTYYVPQVTGCAAHPHAAVPK